MADIPNLPIILASESPTRLDLLKSIRITPDLVIPSFIDEKQLSGEKPIELANRLALAKAVAVSDKVDRGIIISADTVVAVSRKVMPKALNSEDVLYCMNNLSGKRHRVYTGLCVIRKLEDQKVVRTKIRETVIKFKRLTHKEIESYIDCGEGIGKAGGYSLRGFAESFVLMLSGSHSNVLGLPLYETRNLIDSLI
jgi:septum formation protein